MTGTLKAKPEFLMLDGQGVECNHSYQWCATVMVESLVSKQEVLLNLGEIGMVVGGYREQSALCAASQIGSGFKGGGRS
jgi:hypothetical protein